MERFKRITGIFLIALIGGLSGYIGGISSQQLDFFYSKEDVRTTIIEQPRKSFNSQNSVAKLSREVAMSVVAISVLRSVQDSVGDSLPLLTNSSIISYGAIVTSDGWIAVAKPPHPTAQLRVTFFNGSAAPIDRRIDDTALPLSFLKVNRNGQQAVHFIDDDLGSHEMRAYAATPRGINSSTLISKLSYPSSRLRVDEIRSTSLLEKRRFIDLSNKVPYPYFDEAGSLIGIEASDGIIDNTTIRNALRTLLATSELTRPSVFIRYIDLSHSSMQDGDYRYREGAYLARSFQPTLETVQGTVAIKDGDRIIRVNNDQINESASLSELIHEYPPGTIVTLTIHSSDGTEKTVRIHL